MKILMISTDRKLFEENSAVRQRIIEYGNLVDGLHIVIFKKGIGFEKRLIGNNIFIYPTNSKNKFFYIFDAIRIGRKIIGKNLNRDRWLVTTQDPFETGFVGWVIAKTKRAKLHIQVHTDFLSLKFKMQSIFNNTRSQMAIFLISQADGVRVVSERIKNSIVKWKIKKPEKISILPIFVDIDKIKDTQISFNLKERYNQFDFIILIASRLEKEKNIPLAIEVMKDIVKKYPKTGLIIVGEGSQRNALRKKVLKNNLQNNVIFEGWKNDLISYYKSSDLFLSTSNYEGYGMTLIEAGVSGSPILTTDVGLVGDILQEGNVEICKVGDKECFIKKLKNLLENKGLLKEMSVRAKEDIEKRVISDKQEYLNQIKNDWERSLE